jgi:hypothetical protein
MREITVPSGFFRFGMACTASQITVRLKTVVAVGEVTSIYDPCADFYVWMAHSHHPLIVNYDSRSGAEHDRRELMAALHDDYEAGRAALNEARDDR